MKTTCPICRRVTAMFAAGDFRTHGPRDNPCIGSRCTPDEAAQFRLPPLSEAHRELFRQCWQVGDWGPVEVAFGVSMPHYRPAGRTPEEELADIIAQARAWLEKLVALSEEGCPA